MKSGVCVLFVLAATACQGRTITVDDDGPADFNNIQAAIDDANDGDTVEVQPGSYTGRGNRDIDFLGKAITVTGIDPDDPDTVAQTVIDCNSQGGGFDFRNSEDANSVLNGLTITNAIHSGIMCDRASPLILNCRLIKNFGTTGGGIDSSYSSPIIANCTLAENQASYEGGGVYCYGGTPSLTACLLAGNSAPMGGGISCRADEIVIANCLITGNSGSGVACVGGRANLINCVITGNRALNSGGGILCFAHPDPQVIVTNCIIRGNTGRNGDQIYLVGTSPRVGGHLFPELNVSFSNVQGGAEAIGYDSPQDLQGLFWGQGNIDADPCFVDAGFWDPNGTPEDANDDFWVNGRGDYHLKSQAGRWDANEGRWTIDDVTSPCVDAGDPMDPIGPEAFPNGGIINMGAFGGTGEASKSYFGQPPCETIMAGDVNGDCIIDFRDFRLMALHWMEDRTPLADIPEFYYYSGGGKIFINIFTDYFAVCFREGVSEDEIQALTDHDHVLDCILDFLWEGLVVFSTKPGTTESDIIKATQRFEQLSQVKYASPVFGDSVTWILLTDEFSAKFNPGVTQDEIEELNALHDVEIIRYPVKRDWYLLRVKDATDFKTLTTANIYYENPLTEYASPNFVIHGVFP